MSKPEFVHATFIRASIDRVWQAITDPAFTERYFHETRISSTFEQGADVRYLNADGSTAVAGKVITARAPEELVISWHVLSDADAVNEPASRVTFSIQDVSDSQGSQTKLTVVHEQFPDASVVLPRIVAGWPWIIASLKSLLETGEPLPLPAA